MAKLELLNQDNRLVITRQDFCLTLQTTWENQKVLFILLRALSSPATGNPLFTYQHLADVFGYQHRQNSQNFWQEFEQWGENLLTYLQHKRKVDQTVHQLQSHGEQAVLGYPLDGMIVVALPVEPPP